MKKIIIALVIVLFLFCYTQFESSNIVYANTITTADGIVFDESTGTITGYTGSESSLTIPSTINDIDVVEIGESAFAGNETIKSVTLPSTITFINNNAFEACCELDNIVFPSYLEDIGAHAFSNCYKLSNLTIPNSLNSIGDYAFYSCDLININIQNGVKIIGEAAFCDNAKLAYISIPESVTSIGELAFAFCDMLANINIDENNLFYKDIDGVLFNKSGTILIQYPIGIEDTIYIIPLGTKAIGTGAFANSSNLQNVTMHKDLESIGSGAFMLCSNLEDIYIPSSVTYIFSNTFFLSSVSMIYGEVGSYANTYADTNNISFQAVLPAPESFNSYTNESEYTTNESVVVSWTDSYYAESYGMTIRKYPYNSEDSVREYSDLTGNSKNIGTLPEGEYAVWMVGRNSSGESPLTDADYFTVVSQPGTNIFIANVQGADISLGEPQKYGVNNDLDGIPVYIHLDDGYTFEEWISSDGGIFSGKYRTSNVVFLYPDNPTTISAVITAKVDVSSVSISGEKTTLVIGEKNKLSVSVSPSNASNKEVIWKSSNKNVATVADGMVTALSVGSATISAVSIDGSISSSYVVQVIQEEEIPIYEINSPMTEADAKEFISWINTGKIDKFDNSKLFDQKMLNLLKGEYSNDKFAESVYMELFIGTVDNSYIYKTNIQNDNLDILKNYMIDMMAGKTATEFTNGSYKISEILISYLTAIDSSVIDYIISPLKLAVDLAEGYKIINITFDLTDIDTIKNEASEFQNYLTLRRDSASMELAQMVFVTSGITGKDKLMKWVEFILAVEKSKQNITKTKVIVKCPVSVSVFDEQGNEIAYLDNKEPGVFFNEHGSFYVLPEKDTDDYVKVINLNEGDYKFVISGLNDGVVEYSMDIINEDGSSLSYHTEAVSVNANTEILVSNDQDNIKYLDSYEINEIVDFGSTLLTETSKNMLQIEQTENGYISIDDITDYFEKGSQVQINAEPQKGYYVSEWVDDNNGDFYSSGINEIIYTMPGESASISAVFELKPRDFDNNGIVNELDIILMAQKYNKREDIYFFDLNSDGIINIFDLSMAIKDIEY